MANILADVQDGNDYVTGISQGLTRRRAGAKLATQDYTGAAGDLYGAGMLTEGQGAVREGEHIQDRDASQAEAERKHQLEDATQRADFMKQVAESLTQVPADKRNEAFEHVVPAFEQMGLPADVIQQMRAAPKDDGTLRAFGAEIDNQLKLFSTKDGIVAVTPQGEARLAYGVTPDPLDAELKAARIESARASAARARRPPASRSSAPAMPQTSGRVLGATLDPNDGW